MGGGVTREYMDGRGHTDRRGVVYDSTVGDGTRPVGGREGGDDRSHGSVYIDRRGGNGYIRGLVLDGVGREGGRGMTAPLERVQGHRRAQEDPGVYWRGVPGVTLKRTPTSRSAPGGWTIPRTIVTVPDVPPVSAPDVRTDRIASPPRRFKERTARAGRTGPSDCLIL